MPDDHSSRKTTPSLLSREDLWGPAFLKASRDERRAFQARYASQREKWVRANRYYYGQVERTLRFLIEPQKRVLSVRCQTGFTLEAVAPSRGLGVEISEEMIAEAKQLRPQFEYVCADTEDIDLGEQFDYIIVNDVFDTVDLLSTLRRVRAHTQPDSRVLICNYNRLWQPILGLASKLGMRMPQLEPNWLSDDDLRNVAELAGLEFLRTYRTILFPKWLPFFSWFVNRCIARLPWLDRLCMIRVLVARPLPPERDKNEVSVSVIIPCKNEEGNIQSAVERVPDMGRWTELVFCDDKSDDGTVAEVQRMQREYPHKRIRLIKGPGICKADNVWTGFEDAAGDVLMILDADLTVMPEELPAFFNALVEGRGEFINGSRLVYPMKKLAMKHANYAGNKAFASLFSFILGQRIKDTLCGTKVFWRSDWKRIRPLIGTWGVKDRWGDFELLFCAARRNLRIVDLPIHYQERLQGVTKMKRVLGNGCNMLRMAIAAYLKLRGGY